MIMYIITTGLIMSTGDTVKRFIVGTNVYTKTRTIFR